MTTTAQSKTILEYSLHGLIAKIVESVKDGWEVDPQTYPVFLGREYEAIMVRNATEEQVEHDAEELSKPTKAETLAKARAAKAAKRAADEAEKTDQAE